jgi:hypothetical protein
MAAEVTKTPRVVHLNLSDSDRVTLQLEIIMALTWMAWQRVPQEVSNELMDLFLYACSKQGQTDEQKQFLFEATRSRLQERFDDYSKAMGQSNGPEAMVAVGERMLETWFPAGDFRQNPDVIVLAGVTRRCQSCGEAIIQSRFKNA